VCPEKPPSTVAVLLTAACGGHTVFPFSVRGHKATVVGGEPGCDCRLTTPERNTGDASLQTTSMNTHTHTHTHTHARYDTLMTSAPVLITCARDALLWWRERNECLSQNIRAGDHSSPGDNLPLMKTIQKDNKKNKYNLFRTHTKSGLFCSATYVSSLH